MNRNLLSLIFILLLLCSCQKEKIIDLTFCNSDTDCPSDYFCLIDRCTLVECLSDSDCDVGFICEGYLCLLSADECILDEVQCSYDNSGYQVCYLAEDGFTSWGEVEPCSLTSTMICVDGGVCECLDECEEGTKTCNDKGNVATCVADSEGCLIWEETAECPNDMLQFCVQPSQTEAVCECVNECEHNVCLDDTTLQTCISLIGSGCMKIQGEEDCPYKWIAQCDYEDAACKGKLFRVTSEEHPYTSWWDIAKLDYGFVVGWGSTPQRYGSSNQLWIKLLNSNGINEIKVAEYTPGWLGYLKLLNLPDNQFGVVWGHAYDNLFPTPPTVDFVQYKRYNSNGVPIDDEMTLYTFDTLQQVQNMYARHLADGRFVVSWIESEVAALFNKSLYMQVFQSTGDKLTSEIPIAQGETLLTIHPKDGNNPYVRNLSSGGFAIAWMAYDAHYNSRNGSGFSIKCWQADLTPYNDNIVVKTSSTNEDSKNPSLWFLENGQFLVFWVKIANPASFWYQLFNSDCTPLSNESLIIKNSSTIQHQAFSVISVDNSHFHINWVKAEYLASTPFSYQYLNSFSYGFIPVTYTGGSVQHGQWIDLTPQLDERLWEDKAQAFVGIKMDNDRFIYYFRFSPIQSPQSPNSISNSILDRNIFGQFILRSQIEE